MNARLCRRGFLAGVGASVAVAGQLNAEPAIQRRNIIQSGHSLTDGVLQPLSDMINAAGGRGGQLVKSTIPGSTLDWRWSHPATPDARDPQVMSAFQTFVMTERASLSGTMPAHNSAEWALKWAQVAWQHGDDGRGADVVLYASWVTLNSGPDAENPHNDPEGHVPFRDRLDLEHARWLVILDHINQGRAEAARPVKLIPGTLVMAAAFDAIQAGQAPGLSDISDLFSDDIHLNAKGNYLIALAHFAVIFQTDPRGLPHGVPSRGGPDRAQANWMQELVWNQLQHCGEACLTPSS